MVDGAIGQSPTTSTLYGSVQPSTCETSHQSVGPMASVGADGLTAHFLDELGRQPKVASNLESMGGAQPSGEQASPGPPLAPILHSCVAPAASLMSCGKYGAWKAKLASHSGSDLHPLVMRSRVPSEAGDAVAAADTGGEEG